jgi:hypothetical protein
LGIVSSINGNTVTFTLNKPQKVQVKIKGNLADLAFLPILRVGVRPPRQTYYYGPGVHDVGKVLLNSNEIAYVAG